MSFLNPTTAVLPSQLVAVTASDVTRFEPSAVTFLGAGNATVVDAAGVQTTLTGIPAGHTAQSLLTGVFSTGLTASNIYRSY